MRKIFVVEDDEGIREIITYALCSAGYEVDSFENGEAFLTAISKNQPALVLLDIMLPGADGLSILRKIRSIPVTTHLPVIMLTAKSSEIDKVKGLDMGADDYIPKPFGMMELISRVNAVLRRSAPAAESEGIIAYHNISLDTTRRSVYVGDDEITLTYKEYELLWFFMKSKGKVQGRDKIMLGVWDSDFEGESRTLDMHIHSLRQKLGEAGEYIKTIRNVGYRFGE